MMDTFTSLSLGEIDTSYEQGLINLSRSDFVVFNPGTLLYIGEISPGIFPVYKVAALSNGKVYALKSFPKATPEASNAFKTEVRFSYLQHPNIVKIEYFEAGHDLPLNKLKTKADYFLTAYHSKGTFYDMIYEKEISLSETVLRTYFHQLLSGVEYLHSQRIAHMDIKLENLLVGDNFELKLFDFDLACSFDEESYGLGTRYFRAPEIIMETCSNFAAADIYSIAIVLFVLKTGGHFPHFEEESFDDGTNLFQLLYQNPDKFWEVQAALCEVEDSFFDEDFKELFMMMTEYNPKKRATISQVKNSAWYKKAVLSTKELKRNIDTEKFDQDDINMGF